jgi:signal transduction histidine kinase
MRLGAGRAAEQDSVEGMSPSTRIRPPRAWPRLAWWLALPVVARDAIGGVGLGVLSVLPLGVEGVALGELHHHASPWVPPVLIAAQTLPLALRRIHPGVAFAIVGVAFGAAQLAGVDTGVAGLGLFVAIYSFAAYQRKHHLVIAVAAAAVYAALALALHSEGSPNRPIDWVTFFLVLTTPWFIGQLVRRRLAEQAQREARAAQRAVRDARNQLARDLHDIVTHHVTAIVVQADSAAYLDEADSAERALVLDSIGRAGRRALLELRSLLGALELTAPAPQTDLPAVSAPYTPLPEDVAALVHESRASGYPVALVETGPTAETSEAVAVTLYRVAQEALTNAMKHAPGERVSMTMKHDDGSIELSVVNALSGGDVGIRGRGLTGMGERVSLLGGHFATSAVDGRFVVRVVLSATAEPRAANA